MLLSGPHVSHRGMWTSCSCQVSGHYKDEMEMPISVSFGYTPNIDWEPSIVINCCYQKGPFVLPQRSELKISKCFARCLCFMKTTPTFFFIFWSNLHFSVCYIFERGQKKDNISFLILYRDNIQEAPEQRPCKGENSMIQPPVAAIKAQLVTKNIALPVSIYLQPPIIRVLAFRACISSLCS